ncbi:MAG TPA: DUF177 domain-containing protein, partial [Bacteroidales bacterium]|nr:DUF177 domain-containing protein [Bacteroidales bacterium]
MSSTYIIPLSGLKEGLHEFDFEIDRKFFEKIEESEVKEGKLLADVTVEKRSTHADLSVRINGTVGVSCDRCLDTFDYPVST